MNLIAMTGRMGAGKDSVADYLVKNHGFVKLSFAGAIYRGVNAMFGWTMEQWQDRKWKEAVQLDICCSPRYLLQTLGTEWGRTMIHPDLWLILLKKEISNYDKVVISDCRFDNEAQFVRREGGEVVLVTRPDVLHSDHVSEKGIGNEYITQRLPNTSSLGYLMEQVDRLLERVP